MVTTPGAGLPGTAGRERLVERARATLAVAPFFCLSVTSGATFDLIGTGAPLVLRAQGTPLAALSWLQMIYLPVGIAFLWSPLVDLWRLPFVSHRRGWIILSQGAVVALLLLAGLGLHWSLPALFALALGISVALATMDVALQALVVETVARDKRAATIIVRLVGSSIGSMVGIFLPTAFPSALTLSGAFVAMAVANIALVLPVVFYPEVARRLPGDERDPVTGGGWRLSAMAPRAAVIGIYCIPAILLGATPSLALLDLGLPLSAVGILSGPTSTGITVLSMTLAGYGLVRLSGRVQVLVLATGVTCAGLLLALAFVAQSPTLGIGAAFLETAFDAALTVPVSKLMYRWSEGPRAATDYAVLQGVSFMVSFPARILAPAAAAAIGWPLFFAICAPLYMAGSILLAAAIKSHGNRAAA